MKSHASDLLELATCVYRDAVAKCTANSPDQRDLTTIRSRVEKEGLSFLTITLPTLGSDLETSLGLGHIAPNAFRSFGKRLKVPAFLQGFFALVFDMGTGRILDEPSIPAIEGIRQIAYTFKKAKLDCSAKRIRTAIRQFIRIESDLKEPLSQEDCQDYRAVCTHLWGNIFSSEVNPTEFIPRHGPGATAERISGNQKFLMQRWHERLEPYFPYYHFAFSSESAYGSKEARGAKFVNGADEQPVRVITVPKTLKSPRIIAIEPVCMQYTQQAVSRYLVSTLERSPLTKGHINFQDQSVNRSLAILSSIDGSRATLDLSSASDRVPLSLAMDMFSTVPDLQGAIYACRSRKAELPTGEVLTLRKFASMGSALCFPIEAMYFYTICIKALIELHSLPVTWEAIKKVAPNVHVYGDDIIVPTYAAEAVSNHLQKYYCKVNVSKSHWTGKFRESCGMDAYSGEEVTPTYVRSMRPRNRRDSSALISWVETSNLFYKKGYWLTSAYMSQICERYIGHLPIVGENCAGLGRVSFQPYLTTERWNDRYQQREVRCWVASPVYQHDKLDGYPALAKCLISSHEGPPDPQVDEKHLVRTARHGAVTLKRRWTRPY